jgi:hypothetical protein
MGVVVDITERLKAQKTRDEVFSELMDRRYEQYSVVSKAVGTLRKRGHDSSEIAWSLRYVANELIGAA